jgi:hypothetical protein
MIIEQLTAQREFPFGEVRPLELLLIVTLP